MTPGRGMFACLAPCQTSGFPAWCHCLIPASYKRSDNLLSRHVQRWMFTGASGVGAAALQIAKNVGATVFVTASSTEKLDFCKVISRWQNLRGFRGERLNHSAIVAPARNEQDLNLRGSPHSLSSARYCHNRRSSSDLPALYIMQTTSHP